jgi:C4-dicarboxylate-specific signal transduction histidine kinase
MKGIITICLSLMICCWASNGLAIEKADRISDREIIASLTELKIEMRAMEKRFDQRFLDIDKRLEAMDKRLDGMDKRLDMLQTILLWGLGLMATGIFTLISFVLWDRRTALAPAVHKTKELEEELEKEIKKRKNLEERGERLERAIKEYAQKQPELLNALQAAKLL